MDTRTKVIYNANIARQLLKYGCKIIDIKPDKTNRLKTNFVFEKDDIFEKAFGEINKSILKGRQ